MTKTIMPKRSRHANTKESLWLKMCKGSKEVVNTIIEWSKMQDVPQVILYME